MASMIPSTFFIKSGDTYPLITATLVDQYGVTANLTGASVWFRMTNSFYGNVINSPATVVNATAGQVSYAWGSQDTAKTGTYSCQWYVVYSTGAQESFPQGFYNTVQIDPTLTTGFLGGAQAAPLFNTIWNSTSAPISVQGNIGDFWYDTATFYFYGPKTVSGWPTGTLINPAGAALNTFGLPTANVGMNGFSFSNLGATVIAPTPTTAIALTLNAPLNTTVDVLDVKINSVKYWSINDTGNLLGGGQLYVSPISTTTSALILNAPSSTSVDVLDVGINGVTAWRVSSTGTLSGVQPLTVAPTSTTAVPLIVGTPSGSSAAVAEFQQNSVTVAQINSAGNTAIVNNQQLDLTSAQAASPILGRASNFYLPTWGAATTAPVIGSGTLGGYYLKTGRLVQVWIKVVPSGSGTATTFGTGIYNWSLPVAAQGTNYVNATGTWILTVGGVVYTGVAYMPTASTISALYPAGTATGVIGGATSSNPAAWTTTTTSFSLSLTYESAV
jgi:hypothetical protein